ncbi:aldo/keto reductase [Vibrio renipiscarius]|uniref:Aldo/keto reductase n=1 Tax=Vibrio renipiscarius TaxID=1461322 RepID=A0A0C2NLH5_9VIBR|nr:aldo/keto reductase [Vibrio renipiscarius]KII77120.1 aldo/keto reductase [Vibrio renipiscarius]KII77250.1 aldo/keto reductase [Vibrio renipiscarius]
MKFKQIKDMNASAVGFGCWAIGGTWNNVTDDESIRAIKTAIDTGINFFDVAPVYGKGHAETVLGQALKTEKRESIIIATKCGLPWSQDERRKTRKDLTKASIFKEIDDSLTRLQTDYIDLYQVHWPDPNTPISETADALAELKKQGKIRHVGVSNYSLDMTREMMAGVEVATFQGLYNLLEQNPEHYHNIPLQYRTREEALPFCKAHDMKYLPYSPLMQGLLTGTLMRSGNWDENDDRRNNPKLNGEAFEPYFNCVEELKVLAKEANIPLAHLAIHWLVAQDEVGPVIAGAYTQEQVRDNAAFVQSTSSIELLKRAEEIVAKWQLR